MGLEPAKWGERRGEGLEGGRKGCRRTERTKKRNGAREKRRKWQMRERGREEERNGGGGKEAVAASEQGYALLVALTQLFWGVLISWLFGETLQAYSLILNVLGFTSL